MFWAPDLAACLAIDETFGADPSLFRRTKGIVID
jgi:hypothetical protein